jgi:hypothetical protein
VGFHYFFACRYSLSGAAKIVEFELPETNAKNVTVGGILKIGVTFWSNSAFYSEKFATLDSPRREEHSHQDCEENWNG